MAKNKNKLLLGIFWTVVLVQISSAFADNVIKEIIIRGRYGSANGQFGFKVFKDSSWIEPTAIAVDSKGNIYIADPLNNRVQKFNKLGKFLLAIRNNKNETPKNINDITVDDADNVYVLCKPEQKINIYNPSGKLIRSILFRGMDIVWNEYREDKAIWDKRYLQAERISVDAYGSIYVEGSHELIKFSRTGNVLNKWSRDSYSRARSFFIDAAGTLYFSKQIGFWEKYDKDGNYLGRIECEKETFKGVFPSPDNGCHFPPEFIDKNGFRYYFELKPKTGDLESIVKIGEKGNFKKYKMPPIDTIGQSLNMFKFDNEGNFYGYGYDDVKQEYWIIRTRFE